ncbi:phosphoribosylanthranilate isomerase [Paracoccus sp. SCSIO 75233]|uniref:phosphoribosylanthranilate isomerase n=1 Tax=Paracoccus sp. SCSIO 75233 TaxID=3017782 RepID=UPI0022EFEC4A|nr:phosphoribosylanthranilate isomerase [Paracoccus sp. SCSIO 75233]WBU54547.1 phosphoribosylanthranilate isomerase [Paracoccus sp. SCSIO 75233]
MAQVKICGLTRPDHIAAAVGAGAAYLGFNFFPKSPRYVSPEDAAALAVDVPTGVARVGLFVNPDDDLLRSVLDVVPLDIVQLHGAETPERVTEVKALTGLPVMKAVGVAGPDDLDALWDYGLVADLLLVDAKAPKDAVLPGGNGLPFDWRLLVGRKWLTPWMLAGGLTPKNVGEAIRLTGTRIVDVSSGVESAPGQKDPDLIRQFIAASA